MATPTAQLNTNVAPRPTRTDRHLPLLRSLVGGLVAMALSLAFVVLGSEVTEGDTLSFDMGLLQVAQSLRDAHPWVVEVFRDLSSLGSTTVMTAFTLLTVAYLVVIRARLTAALVAASVVTGAMAVGVLKATFGRVRPGPAFSDMVVPGLSFPSGHAGMSAIVFLTLGVLIAATRSRAVERSVILGTAVLMTALVGISRVVLGVHCATDVVGGWTFGAGWALIWLLLDRRGSGRTSAHA